MQEQSDHEEAAAGWLASDLCAALHALSLDGVEALAMQAPDERRARHLALAFGAAVLKTVHEPPAEITPRLLQTLNQIAALLSSMSAQPTSLWTDEAVMNDPSWHEVRTLARAALSNLATERPGKLH